jgi:O-antigen ligase
MATRPMLVEAGPLPLVRLAGIAAAAALLAALLLAPSTVGLAVVGLVLAAPVAVLVWRRPELAVVGLLFVTAGLVPREGTGISLGGARINADDGLVLVILGMAVLRGIAGERVVLRWWSVSGPALAFACCAFLSAAYAIAWERVQVGFVLSELRPAMYCLAAVIGGALLVRREQVSWLLAGMFLIADLTAAIVMLQQFLGADNKLLAVMDAGHWQVNSQIEGGSSAFGAIRIVPPAHVLLALGIVLAFSLMLDSTRSSGWRLVMVGQMAFLSFGSLLTYTRAQWLASAISIAVVFAFLPWQQKLRLGRYFAFTLPVVLLFGTVVVGLAGPAAADFVEALSERATSILTPEETLDSASLEWRLFENEAAIDSIKDHPLIGVGLGNDYRPMTILQGEARGWLYPLDGDDRLTRFVHNGYLYLTTKMGLIGMSVFAWMAVAFVVSGVLSYRRIRSEWSKSLALPLLGLFVGLLEWSIFEAHLMLAPSLATVGAMIALFGTAVDLDGREAQPEVEVIVESREHALTRYARETATEQYAR